MPVYFRSPNQAWFCCAVSWSFVPNCKLCMDQKHSRCGCHFFIFLQYKYCTCHYFVFEIAFLQQQQKNVKRQVNMIEQ